MQESAEKSPNCKAWQRSMVATLLNSLLPAMPEEATLKLNLLQTHLNLVWALLLPKPSFSSPSSCSPWCFLFLRTLSIPGVNAGTAEAGTHSRPKIIYKIALFSRSRNWTTQTFLPKSWFQGSENRSCVEGLQVCKWHFHAWGFGNGTKLWQMQHYLQPSLLYALYWGILCFSGLVFSFHLLNPLGPGLTAWLHTSSYPSNFLQISTAATASYHSSLPVKLQWCLLETGKKEKLESIPASNEVHTHTRNLVADNSHPAEETPMASSLHQWRTPLMRALLLTLYLA